MDPDAIAADPAAAAQVAQLKALQAQLEKSRESTSTSTSTDGKVAPSLGDEILFGYSFAGIMAALVWSTVGIGMIRYAKVTGQIVWGIAGALLFVLTYASTNDIVLWAGGAGIIAVTLVVKRFVTF